eukprot:4164664-Pleurochrysis_carterae.AAC.2
MGEFAAKVVEIVSGDTLIVADLGGGAERRFSLSSVRAPKARAALRPCRRLDAASQLSHITPRRFAQRLVRALVRPRLRPALQRGGKTAARTRAQPPSNCRVGQAQYAHGRGRACASACTYEAPRQAESWLRMCAQARPSCALGRRARSRS